MSGSNDLIELDDGAAAAKPTTKSEEEVADDSSLVRRAIDQFPSDSNMDMEEGKVPIEQDRQSSGKRTAYKSKKTGSPPPKSRVSFGEDAPEVHHLDDEQEERAIRGSGRLSMVSKMYDIDGDGKLDEAELAMRNLDKSGRGFLTNDKVFALMTQQMEQQKQLFRFKKIMIGLAVIVFLLTLSNLGTSFAAAYLAKDTSINDKEELVHANSKQTVSTQTTTAHYGVESLSQEDGEVGRRMQEGSCYEYMERNGVKVTDCTGVGYFINDKSRTGACDSIVRQCLNKNAVDLDRTFGNGEVKSFPICGLDTEVSVNERKGRVTLKNPNMSKINLQYTDEGCKFDGDDLMQDEGDPCDFGSDCIRGYKCYKMDQERVRSCESTCSGSFQKTRQKNRCFNACGGNTCERINDYMILAGTTYEPTESPSLSPTTPRPTPLPTTPKPTGSPSPTYMTPSSNPTATSTPSKSSTPSLRPSLSSAPSVSTHPSQSPSLSSAPSKSSAPSNSPTMRACPPSYTGIGQATFVLQDHVWESDGNGNWVKVGKCVNNIVVYGLFD